MIRLEPHARGVILRVRAQPGARRNTIVGEHNGQLKVAVTQVAEKGKANDAVLDVLCGELSLRRSHIEMLAGHANREKKFLVTGISPDDLAQRIESALK